LFSGGYLVFRRLALILALTVSLVAPLRAQPLDFDVELMLAQAPVAAPSNWAREPETGRITALAVGALAGVVALNFYMGGLAYLPFTGVVATTPLATAESIVAISRVYAVGAAGAGALIGNYIYERQQRRQDASYGR
jgi:hypothetical protein